MISDGWDCYLQTGGRYASHSASPRSHAGDNVVGVELSLPCHFVREIKVRIFQPAHRNRGDLGENRIERGREEERAASFRDDVSSDKIRKCESVRAFEPQNPQ